MSPPPTQAALSGETPPPSSAAAATAGDVWRAIAAACGPVRLAAGIAAAALLGAVVMAAQRPVRVPAGPTAGHAAAFWTAMTPLEDGRQMLLVVDPENRALAVYHVDPAGGTVTLKSSRDISWDLLVGEFNAQEPKPAALKRMLEMPK